MASLTLLGLGLGRGDLAGFASAIGFVGLIAVPAGALTMAAVGLPFLVSLGRGRRPWVALGLAAVLAPPAVIASVVGALALMQLFV